MSAESGRKYKHDILVQKVFNVFVIMKYFGLYSCSRNM